ncbi:MAG: DsrE family protein [Gammaproteobacteria bacterium]|nr:DsrE family protein [Gammaproteobacteria bacterium]MCP5423967.1 DsrE family protein [Gammaproteobacteria bacterium]MCP5459446.1 DsrE family protein [Gammaproteobacteria bacterium]
MFFLSGVQALHAENQPEGLFVNLTSDDVWRANMALSFAAANIKAGHPVTVFLNVTGVRLAVPKVPASSDGVTGKTAQQLLQEILDAGGKVIVCPMCLKHSGFTPEDLMPGTTLGKPEITLPALYGSAKVMSY